MHRSLFHKVWNGYDAPIFTLLFRFSRQSIQMFSNREGWTSIDVYNTYVTRKDVLSIRRVRLGPGICALSLARFNTPRFQGFY